MTPVPYREDALRRQAWGDALMWAAGDQPTVDRYERETGRTLPDVADPVAYEHFTRWFNLAVWGEDPFDPKGPRPGSLADAIECLMPDAKRAAAPDPGDGGDRSDGREETTEMQSDPTTEQEWRITPPTTATVHCQDGECRWSGPARDAAPADELGVTDVFFCPECGTQCAFEPPPD
jgi:hypothetical protein